MLSRVLEQLFVFLLLLSSMNVVTALTKPRAEQSEIRVVSADVNMASVAIESSVYIYGAILVLMRWRRVLHAARTVWSLLALAGLTFLSTTWSVQPIVTLRRSVSVLAATMIAIYLGERYSVKTFARLLAHTLCFMMMIIVVIYCVAPEYVVDYSAYAGAWKGLSAYKNTFGEYMAVAVVLLTLVRFHRFCWLRYVFLLTAAGLLVLSRSAAALVCCVLSIAAMPLWRLIHGKQRLLVYPLAALTFFLGIYFIIAKPELLVEILGRDPTLTGRTHLWAVLLPAIAKHPILGYGYGAFWIGLKGEVLNVWTGVGWMAPIADNGYIDLCLSLGVLGVCVFLYIFVRSFRRAIDYVRSEPGPIDLWPVTYLCLFAVNNICESQLLTKGTFPFLAFAVLTTSLAMNHQRVMTSALTAENQPMVWA